MCPACMSRALAVTWLYLLLLPGSGPAKDVRKQGGLLGGLWMTMGRTLGDR